MLRDGVKDRIVHLIEGERWRLTDELSKANYRNDRLVKCSWKVINGKPISSFRRRQWIKRLERQAKREESRFSCTDIPGKNRWSMQLRVAEGKGWKGDLVMTRAISLLDLSFPLSLSLSCADESKRSTIESWQGGPFARTFPGIFHLPKRKSKRKRKRRRRRWPHRDFLRQP